MKTREEATKYGLSFPDTYLETPFHDPNWELVRVHGSKKAFLWVYERNGYINLNVKVRPEWRDFWRDAYASVLPGYHQNKEHWNTIILDGTIPDKDVKQMIAESYDIITDSPTKRIYEAVKTIPKGKVATYGRVAELAGNPRMSRAVGNALHHNPDPEHIPCYRVVNSKGELAGAFAFGGEHVQEELLKAEGSYILPDNVPSNEFLNLEGDKISTSRNWAVWLHEYLADFPGKQDVLRYVLTANAPETKDNDFTWKDFQARNNNELVAVYGNFVNRAMVLTQKYFDGRVPAQGSLTDYDKETLKEFADVKAEVEKLLDVFKFRDAQKEAMNLARIGNKYLADTEPWKLAKTDMERVGTILNISLQLVANLAIAFDPFLPFSSEKLRKMLNMDTFEWSELGKDNLLPVGHQLNKPELLFEKIEDATIEAQVQKLLDTKKANEEANYKANPIRPNIEFDDFTKLDIRVGTILECQKVPKADKLLQFKIDDGLETRTIVSGIAKHYQPEELVGKQVCFIANLAPRKLKGIVSEGMILSAENNDGSLAVIMPGREVKPGSEVK